MQTTSKTESGELTDYHHKKNEEGKKAVEEMSKHPLSLQQIKEQIARRNAIKNK